MVTEGSDGDRPRRLKVRSPSQPSSDSYRRMQRQLLDEDEATAIMETALLARRERTAGQPMTDERPRQPKVKTPGQPSSDSYRNMQRNMLLGTSQTSVQPSARSAFAARRSVPQFELTETEHSCSTTRRSSSRSSR